ncbi:MAG: OmpA family protein [Acidobacteria bacterium]|nr:OmpA family protein [Acidobacteriota bacterium]
MKPITRHSIIAPLVVFFATLGMLAAQDTGSESKTPAPLGVMKTQGVVVERSTDTFTLRDEQGSEMSISVTDETVIKEQKRNFFRKANSYTPQHLLLGLKLQVKGHGTSSGELVAQEIKFTQDDLRVAQIISSRVSPVEMRVEEAHNRQDRLEERTEIMSGEITELNAAFRVARSEAQQAQRTADRAISRADNTDKRVSALDDYQETHMLIIAFSFNSSSLTGDARTQLDGLARQTNDVKGYLIEVKGFASSDGDDRYNALLSQRRAETVVRYLIETHQISLRRIITPHGYGELAPAAENSSFQGRQQNRRVEVRILVNKGLEAAALDSFSGNESANNF